MIQSSSLTAFQRQINLFDLSKYFKGLLLILIHYMLLANCLCVASVIVVYGDLWYPVSQLQVLSSSVIYVVCYAENK